MDGTRVKKPFAKKRRVEACEEWLGFLEPAEIKDRYPKQGSSGFYAIERIWLARYCVFDEIRAMFRADLQEKEDRRQARTKALAEQKQAVSQQREEDLTSIRESIEGLDAETHGTVRGAAMHASELYRSQHIPRTLKQCIAIAAAQHLVSFGAVSGYLAGVGVRVMWARVFANELYGEGE